MPLPRALSSSTRWERPSSTPRNWDSVALVRAGARSGRSLTTRSQELLSEGLGGQVGSSASLPSSEVRPRPDASTLCSFDSQLHRPRSESANPSPDSEASSWSLRDADEFGSPFCSSVAKGPTPQTWGRCMPLASASSSPDSEASLGTLCLALSNPGPVAFATSP